jgi:hypothetical protein
MTIIDCTIPQETYILQLEKRFKQTAKRYREKTRSKLKILAFEKTNRYGLNSDLLVTIEINKETMLAKQPLVHNISTSNGALCDNIALYIEREIFLKHRWFLNVVTQMPDKNYYEHYDRQIDPSDDVVVAGHVLEAVIFVQKPIMDVTASLAYNSRGFCSLP